MGGRINIAVRLNDGKTVCVDDWTNTLSPIILNETTLSGDDSVVRDHIGRIINHKDYGGRQPFRKSQYGIVVIDFLTKEIHSQQGYASFDRILAAQLFDVGKSSASKKVLKTGSAELLDNGRITIFGSLFRISKSSALNIDIYTDLKIDLSPMKLFEYREDDSLTNMKTHLRKTGFPINKKDGLNI